MKKVVFLLALAISFKVSAQYTDLLDFNGTNGANPYGDVTLSKNVLYGMTYGGGNNGLGTIFSIDTNGNRYTDLEDFNSGFLTPTNPYGSLTLSGKSLYGMTYYGGAHNIGMIFSIDTNSETGYKLLFAFTGISISSGNYGSFIVSGDSLYGMTYNDGTVGGGTIFSIDTNGTEYTDLHNFDGTDGANPYYGRLTRIGSLLFGMTYDGGANGLGNVFSMYTNGSGYTDLYDFSFAYGIGENPYGGLTLSLSGNVLYGMTYSGGTNGLGSIFSMYYNGTGYTDLYDFGSDYNSATNPYGSLTLSGNVLYGMTSQGGAYGSGSIFSINTDGSGYTDLLDFNGTNGANPSGDLTLSGNVLYGMTNEGGVNGQGVTFRLVPISATASVTANVTCNGGNNGSAHVSPITGSAPFTYSWNDPDGQTTATAAGLTAGSYTVTVTDANSCNAVASVIITEPVAILPNASVTVNITCNGGNNGSMHVSPSGGHTPYTYSWNDPNAQTMATATGLTAGRYTVTVTDANTCTGSASVSLTEPVAILPNVSVTATITCNGGNNGSALVSPSNGHTPYTYLWNAESQTTAMATGLITGSYIVTVTDANTCSVSTSVSINEPNAILPNASITATIKCNGDNNGSAYSNPTGGTGAYSYLWNDPDGQTTSSAIGLTAGNYTVTVTDANTCTGSASVDITEPNTILPNTSVTANVTCNGGNNGIAFVSPSGGSTPYTYSWNDINGQTTATATGLSAGIYTVTVKDKNSCSAISTATITAPAAVTAGAVVNTNSTECANIGSATVTPGGGAAPYTYSWNDAGSQTTAMASGLAAGSYTVTVRDKSNCSATAGITITAPAVVSASAILIRNTTECSNTGIASVIPDGGVTPYAYSWTSGGNTNSFLTGLSVGSYTVTVKDNNNCASTASVSITAPSALTAGTSINNNVTTACTTDGSVNAIPGGGAIPYTYSWNDGTSQTTITATGLAAGSYTVTVTDNNTCSATANISITAPVIVTASAIVNSNTTACTNIGNATVTPGGGNSPYTYLWSDGASQNRATASGLSAGGYTVTVTDNHSCSATASITITAPGAPVSASATVIHNTTECTSVGIASVIPGGGTTPYTYSWTGGNTNSVVAGLSAGGYTITVHDNSGCSTTTNVTITTPSALTGGTTLNSNCTSACSNNGNATANPSGGNTPYTYLWSDGASQTTEIASGLSVGTYTVTVHDNNNCSATASISIGGTAPLTAGTTVNTNATDCANIGSATANPSGGKTPYTYLWNDGASQAIATATGLSAGSYIITVHDNSGCSNTASATITAPATLSTSTTVNSNTTTCANTGRATANPSGGKTPYTYLWNDGASQATATATGLSAGTYVVTLHDNNGCSSTANIAITGGSPLTASGSVNQNATECTSAGIASVTLSGGISPYTYSWTGGNTNSFVTGLSAGGYTITATDNNGCSTTTNVTITAPAALTAGTTLSSNCTSACASNGSATANPGGGSIPYTYLWNDETSQTTATASGLSAGSYTVIVHDNNACSTTASVSITAPPAIAAGAIINTNSTECANTGSAGVTPGGGSMPYTYLWNDGASQTTVTATALSAGSYTVIVHDNKACSTTASVSITAPSAITAGAIVNANSTACANIGMATVTLGGGAMPYTYSWNDGASQTTAMATGLAAGSYTVIATDNNSCSVTAAVSITAPVGAVSADGIVIRNATECANTGIALVIADGGTVPYTYSWTGLGNTNSFVTGLTADNYTVIVTDANTCSASALVSITEPNAITVIRDSVDDNGNNNGVAGVTPSGGTPPYTYSWTPDGKTTSIITGLGAGTYTCNITDNTTCNDIISIIVKTSTGIQNMLSSASGQVNVYPNPNNGLFTIILQDINQPVQIEIYNMLGEKVYRKKLNSNNTLIDFSSQQGALYMYRVTTESGQIVGEGKVVVEH